jgi:Putative zinc-finger
MAERRDKREAGKWSGMRPHEEFLELCALLTSGDLTEEEQQKLREHLAVCAECRQALKEFEAVTDLGMPLLSSELSTPRSSEGSSVPSEVPEASPAPTPAQIEKPRSDSDPIEQSKGLIFAHRDGHRRTQVNWNYVWMPFAAAVLLTVALGIYSYQVGRRNGLEVAQAKSSSVDTKLDALEGQMSDLGHEREVLKAQLAERDRMIQELRRQVENESAVLAEMKSVQANLERSLENDQAENQQVVQERSNLTQKLDAAQASLQKIEAELDSVQQERAQDQLRARGLEGQIKDLYGLLREREQTIGKQQQLLAYDRDIRDLMGARDLYIAEVYDVARDGATRKPYGRIFYTKGKSLIFYAYDLDQQAGVKNASTFQAWGQRGPDKQQAVNLGIFYQDNVAGRRWVLKVDNPRTLAQIDAVFVTVEPNGGSHKPSGKPLLFAYLKVEPNHP